MDRSGVDSSHATLRARMSMSAAVSSVVLWEQRCSSLTKPAVPALLALAGTTLASPRLFLASVPFCAAACTWCSLQESVRPVCGVQARS